MKIIEITRTVSGLNYDNISAKATLEDGDDFTQKAIELEIMLQKALQEISNRQIAASQAAREKDNTVSLLQDALDYAKQNDIPF